MIIPFLLFFLQLFAQINVHFGKHDKFNDLRRFVGSVHSKYAPEHVHKIPLIKIYSKRLNWREKSELEIWFRVHTSTAACQTCVKLPKIDAPDDFLECSVRGDPTYHTAEYKPVFEYQTARAPDKKKLMIGVPTSSRRIPFVMEQPIISILLPSLLKSLVMHERDEWAIVLMIVFDSGDIFFDSPSYFPILAANIIEQLSTYKGSFRVEIYKHPPRNRVLHYWNWMYAQAVARDYRYFYQLNDDFLFTSSGWLTAYYTALTFSPDVHMAYPFDSKKFGCQLPCQVFLDSRHHLKYGFLFPPEIKNWHGDSFLGLLYGNRSFCSQEHAGVNGRPGKGQCRYLPCRSVDYKRFFAHYSAEWPSDD